MKIADVY
jgi:hypothetical protein